MSKFSVALVCAGLAAWGAAADTSLPRGIQPSDSHYTQISLTEALSGHVVEFVDGSTAFYGSDGRFVYTLREGVAPFTGSYVFGEDGQVCITYDAGLSRCDTYVQMAETMVLVNPGGYRFPVKAAYRN